MAALASSFGKGRACYESVSIEQRMGPDVFRIAATDKMLEPPTETTGSPLVADPEALAANAADSVPRVAELT